MRVTDTKEAFEAAARPDVDPKFHNYVVEGRPEWVAGKVNEYVIPVQPIYQETLTFFGRPQGGPARGGPPTIRLRLVKVQAALTAVEQAKWCWQSRLMA